jgi:hypothetical protein
MKITIVGGWAEDESANRQWGLDVGDCRVFIAACREVGARLAERGHAIVVGNDAHHSADRHVVDGYLGAFAGGRPREPRILVIQGIHGGEVPFANERASERYAGLFTGRNLSRPGPRPRAAEKILSCQESDALVAIGGLQDTYTAGVAALVADKPVVPIASFGGAALELWNALDMLRNARGDVDFAKLADRVWSSEVLYAGFRFGNLDKPVVFVASSGKAEPIAARLRALVADLGFQVIDWRRDFRPGRVILEEIRAAAFVAKYAIVLLTPDDPLAGEGTVSTPRDNVLFEFGYFVNSLGLGRTLAIVQGDAKVLADYGGYIYLDLKGDDVASLLPQIRTFLGEDVRTAMPEGSNGT